MMTQKHEELTNAENEYFDWIKRGLSPGVALEKSAEAYSLRKDTLKKFLYRHNQLPKELTNG